MLVDFQTPALEAAVLESATAGSGDDVIYPLLSGTSHDWRLRCDAVNLYYMLFGLTRPSCLPLPELGLVLNLKEKKAVLNPTIKPELGVGAVMDTPASIGIHGVGMSYTTVSVGESLHCHFCCF